MEAIETLNITLVGLVVAISLFLLGRGTQGRRYGGIGKRTSIKNGGQSSLSALSLKWKMI